MTLISRILGFVRDMLIARLFGAGLATDAFFVAFKVPNFLRRLFVEGAFTHAFVPIISELRHQGDTVSLKAFIDKISGSLLGLLLAITLTGMIAAPVLILALAPGFPWQSGQHDLAVRLLQITLPYLFFIGFTAFAGSILNAYGRFAVPAATPALLNVFMILAAVWLAPKMAEPVTALAWGVFAAGIAQAGLQLAALMRLGLIPKPRLAYGDSAIMQALASMPSAIFSVSVTQINLLLDTLLASLLTAGSVSWLYYSDRLVEFPLGILGITLATVILPGLAKNFASGDVERFSNHLDWGLRLVLAIALPATLGLVLLALPIVSALFQYDRFGVTDVEMTSRSVMAYSVGLVGFILVKILVSGFTSRRDMKTPVRYGVWAMLAGLGLKLTLAGPLGHAGLALATSLAAILNAALLLKRLLRTRIYRPGAGWLPFAARVLSASMIMGGVLFAGIEPESWCLQNAETRLLRLGLWIAIGLVCYLSVLFISGLKLRHLHIHDKMENF